jgi:hypothetical protein
MAHRLPLVADRLGGYSEGTLLGPGDDAVGCDVLPLGAHCLDQLSGSARYSS